MELDGAGQGMARRKLPWRYLSALSLEVRFLAFSLVVLAAGGTMVGIWISDAIRDGVLAESAATSAIYAENFIGPELEGVALDVPLDAALVARLDGLFDPNQVAGRIVSFKLWAPDGVMRYSRDHENIGRVFELESDLEGAFAGKVVSKLSDLSEEENRYEAERWSRLVETYVPVRSSETGDIMAAAEFYELPDDLLGQVRDAQRKGWLVVAAATAGMFILLNGMVRGASRTIRNQNRELVVLSEQLQDVSARSIETTEAVSRRLSQRLHDGPTQHLALANLRVEAVQRATEGTAAAEDADRIAEAIEAALQGLRNTSAEMRLPELEGLTLQDIVKSAVDYHEHRSGDAVRIASQGSAFVPASPIGLTLFRVITEALNNSSLHAGPADREIEWGIREGVLRLQIIDTGSGFDSGSVSEGLGIRGMRERVSLLGGTLIVSSNPGQGTRVEILLPAGQE